MYADDVVSSMPIARNGFLSAKSPAALPVCTLGNFLFGIPLKPGNKIEERLAIRASTVKKIYIDASLRCRDYV